MTQLSVAAYVIGLLEWRLPPDDNRILIFQPLIFMDTRRYEWTHKTKWMQEETEMEPIELSRREPFPENPRQMQYAGQRTAQEVFE